MDNKIINTAKDKIKAKIGKTVLGPINDLVDQNLTDVTTTIGSFVIRSIRGKFQRSITFNIGRNYADKWMEEALYGILYEYNNIKNSSRLEITNKSGLYDGTGMYYRLDDGTHNLKYRNWNILLCIQSIAQQVTGSRSTMQRLYTIITYDLSPEFVLLFEKDMLAHRNSLLKIKADSPTINVFQDYHESDGWTYWDKSSTINKRKLATIYLPMETKKKIVDTINEFFGNKEYYKRHGIAHNLKILLYGPPGPQPLDTMIPTPDGFSVPMSELNPGDKVFSLYGRPTLIEDIREYDELDEYEITFSDGRKSRCADTHQWPTIDMYGNLKAMMLSDIIKLGLNHTICEPVGHDSWTMKYPNELDIRIPTMFGANYDYKPIDTDPWFVGLLISCGEFVTCDEIGLNGVKYLTFNTNDDNVIKEVCRRMEWNTMDSDIFDHELFTDKNDRPITEKYIFREYRDLIESYSWSTGEFNEIPEKYMINSYGVRSALMQGIMDGCGTIVKTRMAGYDNGRFREEVSEDIYAEFKDKDPIIICNFISLMNSCGVYATITEDKDSIKVSMPNKKYQYKLFNVSQYRCELEKYTLRRITTNQHGVDNEGKLSIVSISKTGRKCKMRCLHVADESHIYLTDLFIPTCNTGKDSIAKMIASEWNRNIYYITGGKEGKFIPNAITDNDDEVNHPLMLISDIDKYPYLINEPDVNVSDESAKEEKMRYKQIFGSMINALDGVLSAEGRIIIMTTNHIEKFSDTFLRPGRIDLSLEIGYVTTEVFRKYTYDFYGIELPEDIELKSDKLTIATLQFDVVFLKLNAEEFIAKHVKSAGGKKNNKKQEKKDGNETT